MCLVSLIYYSFKRKEFAFGLLNFSEVSNSLTNKYFTKFYFDIQIGLIFFRQFVGCYFEHQLFEQRFISSSIVIECEVKASS